MREQHKRDASGETLRSAEFLVFRRGRRAFMSQLLASGGRAALATSTAAAVFGFGSGRVRAAAASDASVINFGNAAVGAERVGIAFYSNALGVASPFANQPTDLAKGTLLNSAHRVYFEAALNQETQHLETLLSLNLSFPFSKFGFPAGTFDSAPAMLAFGEQLESVFIGAYLGAVRVSASVADSLGVAVAELAAQIVGVECEHRVLIRDIAGLNPPNNRFFEGDQAPGPGTQVGNTGARSTVYTSGDAAVGALVALGIAPSP